MTPSDLRSTFNANLDQLAGSDISFATRCQAMDAFLRRGYPTRKDEDWKYTDLKPIMTGHFNPLSEALGEARRQDALKRLAGLELAPDTPRLVFLDGRCLADPSAPPLPEGVEVPGQDAAWQRVREMQTDKQFHDYPLAAINTAFSSGCTLIRVGANVKVCQPLHLIFLGGAATNSATQARILIDLGANSRLCVVQHFAARSGAGWTNSVTQGTQEAGSQLTLYRLQEHAEEHLHTELLEVRLARDAGVKLGYVDLGGHLVRNDLRVELSETGSSCDIFGVFLAARDQHMDNHTRIDHIAPHTMSNEAFRGIVGERSRGIFNGKVVVHAGARGTDARQSSDNLLLSERGEVDTKPELEIYTDDVKCAHGATVGELDTEQLFYLRSRGMDEETAKGLLMFAFANDLLRRIEIPELRRRVVAAVAGHLPDHAPWGGPL